MKKKIMTVIAAGFLLAVFIVAINAAISSGDDVAETLLPDPITVETEDGQDTTGTISTLTCEVDGIGFQIWNLGQDTEVDEPWYTGTLLFESVDKETLVEDGEQELVIDFVEQCKEFRS